MNPRTTIHKMKILQLNRQFVEWGQIRNLLFQRANSNETLGSLGARRLLFIQGQR